MLGQERERERLLLLGDHLTVFGVFLLVRVGAHSIPKEKICVHCLLCLIVVIVILSVKDPKIMLA